MPRYHNIATHTHMCGCGRCTTKCCLVFTYAEYNQDGDEGASDGAHDANGYANAYAVTSAFCWWSAKARGAKMHINFELQICSHSHDHELGENYDDHELSENYDDHELRENYDDYGAGQC